MKNTQTTHTDPPQWSPPVIGGSRCARAHQAPAQVKPQWSPPVIGGSSVVRRHALNERDEAAMEPAGHRREQPAGTAGRSAGSAGRNGARRSSAGAGLAKSEPGDLRKVYVVRAVNKARDQNQLYGLVKVQETAADLHASAPRRWSHHLSARSSDDD